ncbi:uncharacterized protein LOC103480347 [Poecilia reticulata]|uniref:Uncharacterized LOC103480347 n=1 Tax=Poecilia reticulata TaxID=8081 RepID=A0A3P9NR32_POERE|nr:PREDICTED: uncharacterized protein LOC103480347 [Poecilia reticulata]
MVMHTDKQSTCHSTDNKADYCIHNKAWMKISGPAAEPLRDVFFGSSVVVQPELKAAGRQEKEVKALQKDMSDRRQTLEEHSVHVGVYNPTGSTPQEQQAEGVKPKRASKVIIKGTDGVQKCIKVLRAYRIVLLGETGAGKSTLGNSILAEEVFKPGRTTDYQIQSKSAHERRITVLDSPGFSHFDQPEAELKDEMARCTARCTPGPHVLLIVLNVEESSKQQSTAIDKICQCLPEEAFKYAAVVFTHCPNGMTIEKYINENQHLKDLVTKCGGRYHVVDRKYSPRGDENDSQVSQLMSMIDKIVIENKGGCFTNEILQADQRDKNNTKSSNPQQSNDNRGNANNNLWISFSGPQGNLVAEALFGSDVAVWQTTQTSTKTGECPTSKQGENKIPCSEPKGRDEEKCKSAPQKNSTSMEEEEVVEQGREADAEVDAETNEASNMLDRRTESAEAGATGLTGPTTGGLGKFIAGLFGVVMGGLGTFVSSLLGVLMGGLGTVGTGLTGMTVGSSGAVGTGLTGMTVGSSGAVGTGLTGMTVGGFGAVRTGLTWVAKIAAGIISLAAAVGVVAWVKKMYDKIMHLCQMIKQNIGIVLLVVAFYFLLFLSFCDRVPMAGTIFLSSGILVMFLVILLLFTVIMKQ